MIQIDQAIFGDKNGGYALLGSSFSKSDIPERLGNSTDLIDRPQNTILNEPVFSGFWNNDHFLFVKSFPDTSEEVRRGRLFSHALIIKKKYFLKIKDITVLIPYFLETINKTADLEIITLQSTTVSYESKLTSPLQLNCGINALIKHVEYNNTIAWVGEDGYLDWISRIWPMIPKAIKLNLKIGVAFNPQKINTELLNLVYIPEDVIANWSNTNFKLIDSNCNETLVSQAANLLAGNQSKTKELHTLINEFALNIEEFDDWGIIETLIPTYRLFKGNDKSDFKELMNFVHLVSGYNLNPKSAMTSKTKLLQYVCNEITTLEVDEIEVLPNPDWSGFANAQKHLAASLKKWLEKNLMKEKSNSSHASLLVKVFKREKSDWWSVVIKENLKYSLMHWQTNYSSTVWNWFTKEPSLIERLEKMIPVEAEKGLVISMPKKIKKDIANSLHQMSIRKKWLHLHGLLALNLFSPKEAIEKQLEIDTQPNHVQIIEIMAKEISDVKFIKTVVKLDDYRLFNVAAKICVANSNLMKHLKIEKVGWQKLWLVITLNGKNELWKGIPNPSETLYSILDYLDKGNNFNSELLRRISLSSFNNLKDYSNRNIIWKKLSGDVKNNFLKATSISCVDSILNGEFLFKDLEIPLQVYIKNQNFINDYLKNRTVSISSKLNLFDKIPLGETDVIYLIKENQFTKFEAALLGEKIKTKPWKLVAKHCYSLVFRRKDLKPTIEQCSEMLGKWERFALKLAGFNSSDITQDECWSLLIEKATKLFPEGPDQNGLWELAGGANADLYHSATGKKRWNEAIRHVKNGGKPDVQSLIDKMLLEYNDSELKLLKKNL